MEMIKVASKWKMPVENEGWKAKGSLFMKYHECHAK